LSHLDELLSVFLDGETTPAESARVTGHLADCDRCRRQLAELNLARAALRSLPTLELPVALVVPSQVTPLARRRSVWVGGAAAVAAAVITIATIVTPPAEPLDLSDVSRQIGARSSLDAGAASLKVVAPLAEATE
jgi:anti-sigma factor RsiW